MRICEKCGHEYDEHLLSCPHCGAIPDPAALEDATALFDTILSDDLIPEFSPFTEETEQTNNNDEYTTEEYNSASDSSSLNPDTDQPEDIDSTAEPIGISEEKTIPDMIPASGDTKEFDPVELPVISSNPSSQGTPESHEDPERERMVREMYEGANEEEKKQSLGNRLSFFFDDVKDSLLSLFPSKKTDNKKVSSDDISIQENNIKSEEPIDDTDSDSDHTILPSDTDSASQKIEDPAVQCVSDEIIVPDESESLAENNTPEEESCIEEIADSDERSEPDKYVPYSDESIESSDDLVNDDLSTIDETSSSESFDNDISTDELPTESEIVEHDFSEAGHDDPDVSCSLSLEECPAESISDSNADQENKNNYEDESDDGTELTVSTEVREMDSAAELTQDDSDSVTDDNSMNGTLSLTSSEDEAYMPQVFSPESPPIFSEELSNNELTSETFTTDSDSDFQSISDYSKNAEDSMPTIPEPIDYDHGQSATLPDEGSPSETMDDSPSSAEANHEPNTLFVKGNETKDKLLKAKGLNKGFVIAIAFLLIGALSYGIFGYYIPKLRAEAQEIADKEAAAQDLLCGSWMSDVFIYADETHPSREVLSLGKDYSYKCEIWTSSSDREAFDPEIWSVTDTNTGTYVLELDSASIRVSYTGQDGKEHIYRRFVREVSSNKLVLREYYNENLTEYFDVVFERYTP